MQPQGLVAKAHLSDFTFLENGTATAIIHFTDPDRKPATHLVVPADPKAPPADPSTIRAAALASEHAQAGPVNPPYPVNPTNPGSPEAPGTGAPGVPVFVGTPENPNPHGNPGMVSSATPATPGYVGELGNPGLVGTPGHSGFVGNPGYVGNPINPIKPVNFPVSTKEPAKLQDGASAKTTVTSSDPGIVATVDDAGLLLTVAPSKPIEHPLAKGVTITCVVMLAHDSGVGAGPFTIKSVPLKLVPGGDFGASVALN